METYKESECERKRGREEEREREVALADSSSEPVQRSRRSTNGTKEDLVLSSDAILVRVFLSLSLSPSRFNAPNFLDEYRTWHVNLRARVAFYRT